MNLELIDKFNSVVAYKRANPNEPFQHVLKKYRLGAGSFYKLAGVRSYRNFDFTKEVTPIVPSRRRRKSRTENISSTNSSLAEIARAALAAYAERKREWPSDERVEAEGLVRSGNPEKVGDCWLLQKKAFIAGVAWVREWLNEKP